MHACLQEFVAIAEPDGQEKKIFNHNFNPIIIQRLIVEPTFSANLNASSVFKHDFRDRRTS